MKIRILLLSCWLGLAGFVSAADGLKIATVDLRKVFDNYWKTKQADVNLKDQAADLEKERRIMVDQYQKGQDNYKKFLDGANDQAGSPISTTRQECYLNTSCLPAECPSST